MNLGERLSKIPRQVIYLIVAAAIIIPLIVPLGLPVNVMPASRQLFDAIEELDSTSRPVLISCDFEAQTMPELYPMLTAILRHCFSKNVPVLLMALWPQGTGMAEMAISEVPAEYGKAYGVDYVFLGYKAGQSAVILGLGESILDVFPEDYYGNALDTLPLMARVSNYDDLALVVTLSAGDPGFRTWLLYAQSRFNVRVGTGMTAVSAADAYPYLNSGQLTGLLAGMKGASEYETMMTQHRYVLVEKPAIQAMDAQSLGHLIIMLFIVIGNIGYFATRGKK